MNDGEKRATILEMGLSPDASPEEIKKADQILFKESKFSFIRSLSESQRAEAILGLSLSSTDEDAVRGTKILKGAVPLPPSGTPKNRPPGRRPKNKKNEVDEKVVLAIQDLKAVLEISGDTPRVDALNILRFVILGYKTILQENLLIGQADAYELQVFLKEASQIKGENYEEIKARIRLLTTTFKRHGSEFDGLLSHAGILSEALSRATGKKEDERIYVVLAMELGIAGSPDWVPPEDIKTIKLKDMKLIGASQGDVAKLVAEDIDWEGRVINFERCKTRWREKKPPQLRIGRDLETVLKRLPSKGPLFPYLISLRSSDRATEFQQRCAGLGIKGVTLHSYRYSWAERAKTCGYLPKHQSTLGQPT